MAQFFSRPDWHFSRCGHLNAVVTRAAVGGAPSFMRALRLLFVSDVHAAANTTREDCARLVGQMAALSPDLVLLGGDYADRAEHAALFVDALRALRPPLGMFAVLGNNDREAWEDPEALRTRMAAAGCALLINQSRALHLPGGRLWIAGVDEHRRGAPDPRGLYPDAPWPGMYRVLLSHYPRLSDPMPDLMLCGHTHGGQFNLLGVTPYTIGFERLLSPGLSSAFISGLHPARGGQVLVSKGIGASRIPLRIGVRPEINLIEFK